MWSPSRQALALGIKMHNKILVSAAILFACAVGVALAGASPEGCLCPGACTCPEVQSEATSCHGSVKAESSGCHGSSGSKSASRSVERRSTRRMEARAARSEARAAALDSRAAASEARAEARAEVRSAKSAKSVKASCHGG